MSITRRILIGAIGVLAGAMVVSCADPKISGVPTAASKPDFTALHADTRKAATQSRDTTQKTAAVVSAFREHEADTQPTSVFVAQAEPLALAADTSANQTYVDIGPIGQDVFTVETQSNLVFATQNKAIAAAQTNTKAATEYKADYTKERNSIFGGKLGHWLSDALWIGGIIGVLFLVSQVMLSSFPGTGWINFLSIPIHIVGNIVRVAWACLSSSVSWAWNELALWHVPWGQSALPTKQTPPPAPTPAAPVEVTKDTLPSMAPTEPANRGATGFGFRPTIHSPILLAAGSTILTLSLA